jgi:N-methylhydantoinase B
VDEYALVEDSGGAGKQRGGLGIARQIRAIVPGTIFSVRSDSHTVGVPSGVFEGSDGRRARLVKNPGRADEEVLFSKVARIEMKVGDAMRIETPGAGGYGSPRERPAQALAADLKSGKVTRAAAERDYGKDKVAEALALIKQRND